MVSGFFLLIGIGGENRAYSVEQNDYISSSKPLYIIQIMI